jgi:cytochrome d ubiquinol oxidase subunit I
MLAIGVYGSWVLWRGKLERQHRFLRLCSWSAPAGFIAVIAGWLTAEAGRQPYTVYGLLRTADSASPVTANAVGMSLAVFIFVYLVIFGAGIGFMLRIARDGPAPPAPHPRQGATAASGEF